MALKHTIQIDVITQSPFELKPKINALKELAMLDNDTLAKLAELGKSKIAIDNLKSKFLMIKSFLGI
jgi:hypothetical protein